MAFERDGGALGVDIGGTYIRFGRVDGAGGLSAYRCERIERHPSRDTILRIILDNVRPSGATGRHGTSRLGIAVPGTLNEQRTTVARCVNLPCCDGWHLPDALAADADLTVVLFTDAEAAAWGEYFRSWPRPTRFVHLRLGTGVACGGIVDGQLQRLDAGRAQHLEWLVVDRSDRAQACPCGRSGCLETMASGPALMQTASAAGFDSLDALHAAAAKGEPAAESLLDRTAGAVVAALQQIADRFQPQLISLGGGVVEHLPALGQRVITDWDRRVTGKDGRITSVVPASLGDRAGVVGAALLAMRSGGRGRPPVA